MKLRELEIKRLESLGYDLSDIPLDGIDYPVLVDIADFIEAGQDLEGILKPGITTPQLREAVKGKNKGYDLKFYDSEKFDYEQMSTFTEALDAGIDPSLFCDPKYDYDVMEFYIEALKEGKDITPVLDERLPKEVMAYMLQDPSRNEQFMDLLNQPWSRDQLLEICYGFFIGVDPTPYITLTHNRNCIHLINRTLAYGLDASYMALPGYNEAQIENLFFGLLAGHDVSMYANPEINYREMYMYDRVLAFMKEENITDFEEAYIKFRNRDSI